MKNKIFLIFGSFVVIALLFTPIMSFLDKGKLQALSLSDLSSLELETPHPAVTVAPTPATGQQTVAQIAASDLPVGEVENYETDQSWGTVYFIPQNHRYPGTSVEDPKNDSAEIAQNQIFEIIKHLHEQSNVDFIMAEGDLYGEVPSEKVLDLKEKQDLREEFVKKVNAFKNETANGSVDEATEAQFFERADNFVALLDREISLKGAPLKVKADEEDMIYYGSENQATRDESADIVRDYIYQKDQLQVCESGAIASNDTGTANLLQKLKAAKQMDGLMDLGDHSLLEQLLQKQGTSANLETMNQTENNPLSKLKELLSQNGGTASKSLQDRLAELKNKYQANSGQSSGGASMLQSLLGQQKQADSAVDVSIEALTKKALEQKNQVALNKLEDIQTLYKKIKDKNQVVSAASAGPSRQDNPYKNITSAASMKSKIKQTEDKIQQVVIDQRNQETAANFKSALLANNKNTGILQFGAGHEEGLIKELQKQGLSVVVIKPAEVLRREQAQSIK